MAKNKATEVSRSITRRDGYIIAQALSYASEWLKSMGLPFDEPSNRKDMDAILVAMGGIFEPMHRDHARLLIATTQKADLASPKLYEDMMRDELRAYRMAHDQMDKTD